MATPKRVLIVGLQPELIDFPAPNALKASDTAQAVKRWI
jgi:hypothetical protein